MRNKKKTQKNWRLTKLPTMKEVDLAHSKAKIAGAGVKGW